MQELLLGQGQEESKMSESVKYWKKQSDYYKDRGDKHFDNYLEEKHKMRWGYLLIGLLFGAWFVLVIIAIIFNTIFVNISQETADDICKNLTGNETVKATDEGGKLICEVPDYDSTLNIVIRKAGEEKQT